MKLNRSIVAVMSGASLLILTGCTSGEKQATATTEPSPTAETSEQPSEQPAASDVTTEKPATTDVKTTANQGGQVLEVNGYHLELVPVPEATGIHLDLFLQDSESHQAISDAKVTAQVELPNGSQQALEMTYDTAGEHYMAMLPSSDVGEYKVAVLSDIAGEKVNGRFTFSK